MRKYREFRRSWAGYCTYCGVRLCHEHRKSGVQPCGYESTWDHIVPGLRGKGIAGRAKVVACLRCNQDRGNKPIYGWRHSILQRQKNGAEIDDEWASRVVDGLRWVCK